MKALLISLVIFTMIFSMESSFAKKKFKDRGPISVVTIQPNYPREAAEQGIEGEVTLEFTVTTMGTVTNPVIISSKPEGIFDREALRAILKYKFGSAMKKQKMVESKAQLTIIFKLPEGYQLQPIDK